MKLRLIAAVAAATVLTHGAAQAGQEKKCADQYSLQEQQTLEWAALGGDPHAQFAIAQCALPQGARRLSADEKLYAVKWVLLADCDAAADETRDRITRKLRAQGDLSFRRFGGLDDDEEKMSKRDRRFAEYREHRSKELQARVDRLDEIADRSEFMAGKMALADDLSRMGPLGLARLAGIANCTRFDASKTFQAAAWSAAAESWSRNALQEAYGPPARDDWSIDKAAVEKLASLSPVERRTAEIEKARLMRADPANILSLEEKAALGRLQELGFIGGDRTAAETDGGPSIAGQSVTIAAQFAMESLGLMEFVNGPDNDYGPATIEAAARAQAHYGRAPTRWLSHEDVRQMVCDAATEKDDPVSYYHLGVMFSRGWGFPVDLVRARYAINRAETAIDARLAAADDLPDWKRVSYRSFKPRIAAAKSSINAAWEALPEAQLAGWSGRLSDETLCN